MTAARPLDLAQAAAFLGCSRYTLADKAKLGCNFDGDNEFNEIKFGEKRQYARALWLTWAAMIAREEGL